MPNKPTTLRESELKEEFRNWFRDKGDMYYHDVDIADWWLSKFDSHNTELLQKIEERQKLFNFIPQDQYGYKMIKATDLDIISLINQNK